MNAEAIAQRARELGVTLTVAGDRIRYAPKSATPPDFVDALREHKAEVLQVLRDREKHCRNSLTPHAGHEYPWECDPNTCYCYREFGYPRMCQGVPCRWVWPNGVPRKESGQ